MKSIGILVVHGVGEQKTFEHLEEIATNFVLALNKDESRRAHVEIQVGDHAMRHAESESWSEVPVTVRWNKGGGTSDDWVEARFREVYWADLDMPETLSQWVYFVFWALAMPGIRTYDLSPHFLDTLNALRRLPRPIGWLERVVVRLKLVGISLAFFLVLISINFINYLLGRLSISFPPFKKVGSTLYNFVGDVKLYQDGYVRMDNNPETLGEKSRVAIRRRMVRSLVNTAKAVKRGEISEYFIFAHSLGTVVAFNGLMELAGILPRYLTKEEWDSVKAHGLNDSQGDPNLPREEPRRPSWLLPTDQINRGGLFEGLKGLLTMGSPLDKFAALWPNIVPINKQSIAGTIPWINVADKQDIVAGELNHFDDRSNPGIVSGLHLTNISWADRYTPFTAHTSYWKADGRRLLTRLINWVIPRKADDKHKRLIDWVIPWIEQSGTKDPKELKELLEANSYCGASILLGFWLMLSGAIILFLLGIGPWLLGLMPELLRAAMGRSPEVTAWSVIFRPDSIQGLKNSFTYVVPIVVMGVAFLIMVCSFIRKTYENRKYGEWETTERYGKRVADFRKERNELLSRKTASEAPK